MAIRRKTRDQAKDVAKKGRYGDTELVHVTEREIEMLKRMGGSGSINPETGLREFFSAGAGASASAGGSVGRGSIGGGGMSAGVSGRSSASSPGMGGGSVGKGSAGGGHDSRGPIGAGYDGGSRYYDAITDKFYDTPPDYSRQPATSLPGSPDPIGGPSLGQRDSQDFPGSEQPGRERGGAAEAAERAPVVININPQPAPPAAVNREQPFAPPLRALRRGQQRSLLGLADTTRKTLLGQ